MADYYSSEYTFRSNYKYRAKLTLNITSNTTTQYTVSWTIAVQEQHGYLYGMAVTGSGECSGTASGYLTSSPGSTWKTVSSRSGSKTYTKTTSKQTKTFYAKAYGTTVNGIGSAGGSGVTATGSITVPALESYTIKYNANGTGASGIPSAQTKYFNKPLTLSSTKPTRAGFTFKGWALTKAEADSGDWYYYAGATCYQNKNLVLYATWESRSFSVTYYGNGETAGSPPAKRTGIPYGTTITLDTSVSLIKEHYIQDSWNTAATKEGTRYPLNGSLKVIRDTDLYARWTYNATKITYNSNGGSGSINDLEIDIGQTSSLSDGSGFSPNTGEVLKEWNTKEGGDGKSYPLGGSYYSNKAENITLYAIYADANVDPSISYTITRVDKYGNTSVGGKNLKIEFYCNKAKTYDSSSERLTPINGTYTIKYSSDNENWQVYPNYGNVDIDDETELHTIEISNVDGTNYQYFKFLITDGTNVYGDDISVKIPDRDEDNSKREVTVTINSIKRITPSSQTVLIDFNWTPYYDGHEYYEYNTINLAKKISGSDGEESISISCNGISGGTKQETTTLLVEKRATFRFVNAQSSIISEDPSPQESVLSEIEQITIEEGGFPVHINEQGTGITLFGVAKDDLIGFEVNGSTTLNSTLDISGITTLNNTLNINGTVGVNNSFITLSNKETEKDVYFVANRTDTNRKVAFGVGASGKNTGIWDYNNDKWLIYSNDTGEMYANGKQIVLNSNNVLWTGAHLMTAGHTASLKQTVSEQMIGIVLVWSGYTGGIVRDYYWNFVFVPKWFVSAHKGGGMSCTLTSGAKNNTVSRKYVYIYNSKIIGSDDNDASGTGYANNAMVLRAIIGV